MSQKFIDEVRAIVLSNFSDEKFGVRELASLLNLSSSHTLRKVKAETGKSVTQYIRELRLEKAAKLIKKTDYTIAEISYQVGFGSASYFNKAFRKYYGIAPGEYKSKSISMSELAANKPETKPPKVSLKKKIFFPVVLVLLFVIGYLLVNKTASKKATFSNSIAVLPFKDFSPEDSQWFSDGVSDNILHSLAQMKDLSVTSFTSSSTFRDSDKTIPEISNELGVSYILEGSVTLVEGKVKIIAQLIDSNDNHVWSKEYNENFNDIIAIQKNVAQEVMQQLKITLSSLEEIALEKYPTKNMKAYNLFLKGRLIDNSRKREDLKKNIENNKKAIALDSSFVGAYAEVATSNMLLAFSYSVSGNHNYVNEATSYANKALELDPNSARANAVKARIYLGNDWDQCKVYFEKALALNPNDADSHHWYAFYFLRAEELDVKQALQHATIAIKLSPFSSAFATRYTWTLILNEKYEEAEAYMKDYGFLLSKTSEELLGIWLLVHKNKSWAPVWDRNIAKIKREPENAFLNRWISALQAQVAYDENKAIYFAKKASELDTDYFWQYFYLLVNNGFYTEAEQVMHSEAFINLSESIKLKCNWFYYYYKGDYDQAHKIIKGNPENFDYRHFSTTYAHLGERKKLDSIDKLYYLHGEFKYQRKARIHAILKERDSMYYYLNKARYAFTGTAMWLCSNKDLAPYKNEARFKAVLKKFYVPYTHPIDPTKD